jgi:hypothetical protein
MNLNSGERKKLEAMLDQLGKAVEDLLLTGLTTASETTRQTLNVAFQEASRLKLLRLGSTLRVANEELGRFTRNDADFLRGRFSFFLNRAWMLGKGLLRALQSGDDAGFDQLNWTPTQVPIKKLEVVTLGVAKKVAANAFVAFDFRLRLVKPSGNMKEGQRLAWSCIFPLKPGVDIPPEAFLHLPHKQKITAFQFLEGNAMTVESVAVALDEFGGGRLALNEESTVQSGGPFSAWPKYMQWDAAAALKRVQAHEPGPFDLDVEMQEEAFLEEWTIDKPSDEETQSVYPITCRDVRFFAPASSSIEGKALKKHLDELLKKKKAHPPLFVLMHYEKCRLILQPLTVFAKDGPLHLMISEEKIDRKELLKALKF